MPVRARELCESRGGRDDDDDDGDDDDAELNVLGCRLTYQGQTVTNA